MVTSILTKIIIFNFNYAVLLLLFHCCVVLRASQICRSLLPEDQITEKRKRWRNESKK